MPMAFIENCLEVCCIPLQLNQWRNVHNKHDDKHNNVHHWNDQGLVTASGRTSWWGLSSLFNRDLLVKWCTCIFWCCSFCLHLELTLWISISFILLSLLLTQKSLFIEMSSLFLIYHNCFHVLYVVSNGYVAQQRSWYFCLKDCNGF